MPTDKEQSFNASANMTHTEDRDGDSDDYSLASSYDAEVAYKHTPEEEKSKKLSQFNKQKNARGTTMQKKSTAKFANLTASLRKEQFQK